MSQYSNEEYPSLETPPAGSIRFNTDSAKMEIYNGEQWWNIDATSPEQQTGGTRGIFGSGTTPGANNFIGFINVDTTGDEQDFGDLSAQTQGASGGASSRIRGIFAGGQNPVGNQIQFLTIAQKGDAVDFGNLTRDTRFTEGAADRTRAVFHGGIDAPNVRENTIEFVTIASTGDAIDFGDTSIARGQARGCGSPTRGIYSCGQGPNSAASGSGSTRVNVQDFITFSTTGNATDFGDSTIESDGQGAGSNAVRGIWGGGSPAGNSDQQVIEYQTIATLGNALDFGDLSVQRSFCAGASSPTRVVFSGGYTNPAASHSEVMDYVQIATTGNAVDFGDQNVNRDQMGSFSNGHGGL